MASNEKRRVLAEALVERCRELREREREKASYNKASSESASLLRREIEKILDQLEGQGEPGLFSEEKGDLK